MIEQHQLIPHVDSYEKRGILTADQANVIRGKISDIQAHRKICADAFARNEVEAFTALKINDPNEQLRAFQKIAYG